MKKQKIYIAGSLFTDKQIKQRIEEEETLKKELGKDNISIYNPITNDEINDKTKQPTSQDIFLQDTNKVLESDIITADLDDLDMGVAMELGIAYGVNTIIDYLEEQLQQTIDNMDLEQNRTLTTVLNMLKKQFPYKTVYATCSDIRQDGQNEQGKYKSWGQNQYVIGGIEEMGEVYRHFNEAVVDMKALKIGHIPQIINAIGERGKTIGEALRDCGSNIMNK
ncbi:nucleoside 2-deoxyribosyltransferase [Clostridium botulinum C]|uniref:Nucleoside 2-deoxyribosyltransferase n=2 Tax=Clostridium botulinum TaxID=1491 RepID=A0A9Q4TQC0_CLOBO|nr:nucleoside 2-deoxyribosyltransferase [Clostridium botulinum]YP_398523.1 nucleoside 2-deoxyribosyltransferase [Clostridium phage c-st]MCD3194863.1 nucleoside 2-deoxyribosyltransferase [Clostridium botulinum C]MCD3200202.1 nucleoside 2-deoxyribosyltransferase [Clostridium botulinum C]MCD3205731.1 nucleoside 2-deoxyribosyltransferase [Clostridium botulinum C]MCD3207434.1 nucleoside 2-deoxyribosyltransferase [Clostridium botulinum C]MCD3226168.1 nucleoside 2-deoxyribosyltransferase [Clostridiu